MKLRVLACICAALACTPAPSRAQTKSIYSNLANPAIGFNALFLDQAARDLNEPYGPQFQESEISLLSVVDPYWNLWANIVFAPDGVDPEEVYATTTRIPAIQLKIGKLRATFGKHGLLHTHAFPFIQAPVIMANTIGEEGFKAAGMEAAWLTPSPWYCELTGGIRILRARQRPVPRPSQERGRPDRQHDDGARGLGSLGQRDGRSYACRLRGGPHTPQRAVEAVQPTRMDPAGGVHRKGILPGRDLQPGAARVVRVLAVSLVPDLLDGTAGRGGLRQLHGRADRPFDGRSRSRPHPARIGQRRVDSFGVLVRSTGIQRREGGRRQGHRPLGPSPYGAAMLHDRLSPGSRLLRSRTC